MKITGVEGMLLDGGRPGWRPVVCRVTTDEGIYGCGEAAIGFDSGAEGVIGMMKELAPLVIGMDPMANEKVWDRMFADSFWGQGGGTIIYAAISAIDEAVWDIRGKALGVPVYVLLGGKYREHLRCYASQLQFGWGTEGMKFDVGFRAEDLAASAARAAEEGFDAVKINFITYDDDGSRLGFLKGPLTHHVLALVEERVRKVREAVGDDVDILAENHARTDVNSAVELSHIFHNYGVKFMEEPITPVQIETCELLADRSEVPVAGGERNFGCRSFLNLFEHHCFAVAQPDVSTCGGITEAKKIADMANSFDVVVQTHCCCGPIGIAAALQVECAIPNFFIHEHHVTHRSEANISLGRYDYQPVNGQYSVPDLPGLGQDLSEKAVTTALIHWQEGKTIG